MGGLAKASHEGATQATGNAANTVVRPIVVAVDSAMQCLSRVVGIVPRLPAYRKEAGGRNAVGERSTSSSAMAFRGG